MIIGHSQIYLKLAGKSLCNFHELLLLSLEKSFEFTSVIMSNLKFKTSRPLAEIWSEVAKFNERIHLQSQNVIFEPKICLNSIFEIQQLSWISKT